MSPTAPWGKCLAAYFRSEVLPNLNVFEHFDVLLHKKKETQAAISCTCEIRRPAVVEEVHSTNKSKVRRKLKSLRFTLWRLLMRVDV